jgi:chemotaxis receptor (MCP) glutamine deamidase CheD
VAGGAEIMDGTGQFHLGRRNFEALQSLLHEHDLRIHAEQVGGLANRSMQLHLGTGEVRLKTSGLPRDISLCRNSMTI